MSDVRLTATNPEDSSVVPVACNAKGELKLEEPIAPPEFDGNLDGDLTVSGSGTFAGNVQAGGNPVNGEAQGSEIGSYGGINAARTTGSNSVFNGFLVTEGPSTPTSQILASGEATFTGNVVVGSRSKQWMLVESGGLCHMVEQTRAITAFSVDPVSEYPKLRDVFAELDVIEKALEQVMEKLRMVEPDGWPVWDGSDNSQ